MTQSLKPPHCLTLAIAKALRFLDINERRAITVRESPDSEYITVSPEASWDDLEGDGQIYYLKRAELARLIYGEVLLSQIEPLYRSETLFSARLVTGEPASEDKEAQKEEQEEASISPPAPPPMSLS